MERSKMAVVGVIQVPATRWGGRWAKDLRDFEGCEDDTGEWVEIAEYGVTSGYQVARALNLAGSIPKAPEGKRFEFGSRVEANGTSVLLVRCVEDE